MQYNPPSSTAAQYLPPIAVRTPPTRTIAALVRRAPSPKVQRSLYTSTYNRRLVPGSLVAMYSALQRRYKASGREVLGSYSDGGDCRALYSTAAAVVVVLWGEATRVVYLRLIDDVRALIALGELGDVLRGEGDGG